MSQDTNDLNRRRIQSVEIAFDIIDALGERRGIGVTELADELGHSKSTVHSHLQTLVDREMVTRDQDGYRLSLYILDMATRVRDQFGNYDIIQDAADELAEDTGEIIHFAVMERGSIAYLYKSTGEKAVETKSRVGTTQPLHSTSLGKAILSQLPAERLEEVVGSIEFESFTPNTITTADELYEELETVGEQGYAIDDEENIEGVRCIGAPITDGSTVYGAISISGPSSRQSLDRLHDELAERVRNAANIIELNTKFSE